MKKGTTFNKLQQEEEYDRMVDHLKSACATCVYGFPATTGHSCAITRKVASDVVIRCGAHKRRSGVEEV